MRLLTLSAASFFALALAFGCTPAASDAADPGDSCETATQIYTCSKDRTVVLRCNESALWAPAVSCDDTCVYASPGDDAPEQPYCTVEGAYKTFPTPFCFGGCPVEENPGDDADAPTEDTDDDE